MIRVFDHRSQNYVAVRLLCSCVALVVVLFSPNIAVAGDAIWHLAKIDNDPAAQYFLGRRYLHGNGVSKSAAEAAQWFNKAAEQGHKHAQYEMGLLYKNGLGVKKNYQAAFELFWSAAENGHNGAMFELGNHYFFGLDVPSDVVQAISWYKNAAEHNHGAAQYQLGKILHDGIGVKANKKDGRLWLDKARNNGVDLDINIEKMYSSNLKTYSKESIELADGIPEAQDVDTQFKVGMSYLNGKHELKQPEVAARWLREAAKNNHAGAQYELGKMYRDGVGVEQSDAEAIMWLQKAATWGLLAAQTALKLLQEKQLIGYMKDYPSGPDITKPGMQFRVGMLYFNGKGLIKNYNKAFKWIKKAAKNDFADAQYKLGLMYLSGLGVKKDESKAKDWLTRSAANGNKNARREMEAFILKKSRYSASKNSPDTSGLDPEKIYEYGLKHLNGDGVDKNIAEGIQWITSAASRNYLDAQKKIASIFAEGKLVDRDYAIAATWYQKSAAAGDADSQYELGKLYKKGLGVDKNNSEAIKWFRIAARQGHQSARSKLGGCKFC